MTPIEHCRGTAVPPGSARYYALVNAMPSTRPALSVVFALADETRKLARLSTQTLEVRQAKLGWWAEEVNRLRDARPRHPVMLACVQYALPVERVGAVFQCAIRWGLTSRIAQMSALEEFCVGTGGALGEVAGKLCVALDGDVGRAAADIGTGAQLFDFASESDDDHTLIRGAYERADDLLARGDGCVAGADRYRLLPLLTLGTLHRYSMSRLRKVESPGTAATPPWTPLRRLWITWRLARSEKKRLKS